MADINAYLKEDHSSIKESSSLVREPGDVYNLIFALYKVWILKKGGLEPPVNVNGVEWDYYLDRWVTNFTVPGYWKIPYLRAKTSLAVGNDGIPSGPVMGKLQLRV